MHTCVGCQISPIFHATFFAYKRSLCMGNVRDFHVSTQRAYAVIPNYICCRLAAIDTLPCPLPLCLVFSAPDASPTKRLHACRTLVNFRHLGSLVSTASPGSLSSQPSTSSFDFHPSPSIFFLSSSNLNCSTCSTLESSSSPSWVFSKLTS